MSVTPDGRRVVSSSKDGTVRLWDLQTQECVRVIVMGELFSTWGLLVTPDSRLAVSSKPTGTLEYRLWDLESGLSLGELKGWGSTANNSTCMCMTPDGRMALGVNRLTGVRIWDLATGRRLHDLRAKELVTDIAVSCDGRQVAIADRDSLSVWEIRSGKCLAAIVDRHFLFRRGVTVSPDGKRLLWANVDGIGVWDLRAGERQRVLQVDVEYSAFAVTPDGLYALSADRSNSIKLWNLLNGQCLHTLRDTVVRMPRGLHTYAGNLLAHNNIVGDSEFFRIENLSSAPPVVTPTRLFLFQPSIRPSLFRKRGRWDDHLSSLCSWCGHRFIVKDAWAGQEISCPSEGCGKPLQLTPFVCDNSDWLK